MQAGKLRLHQKDRRYLAALLKVGVPHTKIIENIQMKCPHTEWLGLLTRKDLWNLSQSCKVDESVLPAEDAVPVVILKEKEKSVVHEESVEIVYERIRRRMQFINTAASMANAEEMRRLDQSLEDLMKGMGYSEFGLLLPRIENFLANKKIVQQQESRHFKKQKLDDVITRQED
ncbi:hypothetical protein TNCT_621291 [Trichonephila clavata]|uniref:Uncharacterized protein n=1 Tax=Trichonephila clavata TaxID=2740835 RepID=A0A8X6HXX5_TRICU|nr:hypothetical protein TNCT_621291 [Trichonephila clavata]